MIIKKHQTVFDFTTQFGGSMAGVFEVAMANGIGITDTVAPGTDLTIEVKDKKVVSFFGERVEDVMTDYVPAVVAGIGDRQIGIDFIIF